MLYIGLHKICKSLVKMFMPLDLPKYCSQLTLIFTLYARACCS